MVSWPSSGDLCPTHNVRRLLDVRTIIVCSNELELSREHDLRIWFHFSCHPLVANQNNHKASVYYHIINCSHIFHVFIHSNDAFDRIYRMPSTR
jgi:hypothetical protein